MTVPLKQKERFYQQKGRLPVLPSQEVSDFINKCLSYDPMERPSFRVVLGELSEFMKTSAYFYFLFLYLYCCFGTLVMLFFFWSQILIYHQRKASHPWAIPYSINAS